MKQNDNEKQRYEAPRLTAVSFRTERGFALSLNGGNAGKKNIFGNDHTETGEGMDYQGSIWEW